MVANRELDAELARARNGDASAAARVYDATSAQAWLLARCMVSTPDAAAEVLRGAYHEAMTGARTASDLSARAQVLRVVYEHARAYRRNPIVSDVAWHGQRRRADGWFLAARRACAQGLRWASHDRRV